MKYKVWYIPQVPMGAFKKEYDNIDIAIKVYEAIV